MILALVGCLVLIDYTYQPIASSFVSASSSSVISLGQFIVGISLIYLFGGALMYEATGGMAQHVPVQSPHAFFLGAALSFQMIGRTIGPIWAGIACAGFSPEAWVNTNLYDGELSNLWSNCCLSPNIDNPYSSNPSIVGI